MVDPQQASSMKAALLLSRALCSHLEDVPLAGVVYDESTGLMAYEGVVLSAMDVGRGALTILRALVEDLAAAMDLDPSEVGRMVELSASLTDVMGEAESRLDDSG